MARIPIPQSPQEITPNWLTRILRRSGVVPDNVDVVHVSTSDPGREASYAGFVARLTLTYNPPSTRLPPTIIAKLPAPERLIRTLFQSIYRNEALFYRHIAGNVPIPVPACYAALLNRRGTRSLLLLEDLTPIATPGDHDTGCRIDQADIALRRLAQMHADWWEHPDLDRLGWLSQYQVNSRKNWLIYAGSWLPFRYRLGQVTPRRTLRVFSNLWRYRAHLQELESGRPRSLQHGDFRLANLAFSSDDVYVFDWQVIRAGPPLFDVAWFMLTSLTVDQRRADEMTLLRAYHVSLVGSGVTGYAFEEMVEDYRFALLLTIPQIMVIGAFLRIDPARRVMLGELLLRFDAACEDHDLERVAAGR